MDPGKLAVLGGLAFSVATVILYLGALTGNRKLLGAARLTCGAAALSAILCFGRLMWLVTHKQYQYQYVFDYVSPDLRYPFLAAATWAGQEGSFLLWAMWTGIIGCLVAWKAGKWEPRVMPVYMTSLCFLFGILIWLSPYNPLPRGGANGYPLDLPWPPTFGKGLNPSLQNYWMAIHPPTIFFGFASLMVPFAYAISAMLWREYETWAPRVMPWVLMTVATLGVGLFMGGYWAYETQGWHGFWGWDPVENASLFPWLGALALLHGLVVQKSRGGMGRTNLFLAVLSWNLFLYGTFLTRSGVLASVSVHAFDMIARSALKLLLIMIAVYILGGFSLLALRWRAIPGRPISDKVLARDTAMVLAVTLMIIGCVVIALASSWPLVSKIPFIHRIPALVPDKGAVQPSFYNKIGSTLIIPGLLLMGVVPFLAWGKTNADKFLWKVIVPWLSAIVVGALVLWYVWSQAGHGFKAGTPSTLVVAIATLGAFCAFANLELVSRLIKPKLKWSLLGAIAFCVVLWLLAPPSEDGNSIRTFATLGGCASVIAFGFAALRTQAVTMGGWLAHVGIGLLFLGTIITNVYENSQPGVLVQGQAPWKTPFGYSLQLLGWTHQDKEDRASELAATDPQKSAALREEIERTDWYQFDHGLRVRVIPNHSELGVAHADDGDVDPAKVPGSFVTTLPVFRNHMMDGNNDANQSNTMEWPFIKKDLLRDFYVLVASEPQLEAVRATVTPGQASMLQDDVRTTRYMVEYEKFRMEGPPGTPGTKFIGDMVLITPDGKHIPIHPGQQFTAEGGLTPINFRIPEIGGAVMLKGGINPMNHQATVEFGLPDAPPLLAAGINVTNKPAINLVWLGVALMGLGTLCAMVRRAREARKGELMLAAVAQGMTDAPAEVAAVKATATNGAGKQSATRHGKKAAAKT